MPPLRVGLIGCGSIARSAHLPAMYTLNDRVRLVATADLNEAAAQAAAAPWAAAVYTDGHGLVRRDDLDVVMIATPEASHRQWTEAAAAAGKHVLCEKPMAPSLADADAMIAACRAAGVRLMIGHSRRFTRRYLEIRRAIDRGQVGTVRLIRENERRSRPRLGVSAGYYTAEHWTGDPSMSVGAAVTNGIHEADLLRWFAGSEPVLIAAEHKVTVEGNRGVPDFITYTVRFASGAVGSSEISNCLPPGYPAFHQCEIYGTRGAVRAKDHELVSLTRYRDEGADHPESGRVLLHNLTAYVREWTGFLDAVQHDRPLPMPPDDARAALRLALAAAESARTGRVVRLEPEPGIRAGSGRA
ncbi:MAG TPA: Gfo/Idh/MocA family oxidoreductase [bacterium]|nr:Gfo/Idh/MocA family oxidoreductase [bacterium]